MALPVNADPFPTSACIALHARRRPHAPALSRSGCGTSVDYATLHGHLRRTTEALRRLALRPGSLVALGVDDSYLYLLLLLSLGDLGMVVEQFRPCAGQAPRIGLDGVTLVIASAAFPDGLHDRVLRIDAEWWQATRALPLSPAAPPMPRRSAAEAMLVLKSSGTTGRPKRILITRGMLRQRVRGRARMLRLPVGPRCLVTLPLAVAGQFYLATACLHLGGTLILSDGDEGFLAALTADRVTHAILFPFQLEAWLRLRAAAASPLPQLTLAIIGGALPTSLRQKALASLCGDIVSIYSSNEAGNIGVVGADGMAVPVPGVEVQVLDQDSGQAAGGIGYVRVRGPGVAAGYLASGLAMHRDFARDGWVSDDLARLLPDGTICLLGRRDDVANLGGLKVPYGEIESLISRRLGLPQVAVLMRQDAGCRQIMVVCVEPPPGFDAATTHLSLRQLIRGNVELHAIAAIPRTAEGKIRRTALGAQIA